jgi:hypothetical protein
MNFNSMFTFKPCFLSKKTCVNWGLGKGYNLD